MILVREGRLSQYRYGKFGECHHRRYRNASQYSWLKITNIEKIGPRMVCASFNSNRCTTITSSCYCPTNACDETDIITYNELSCLIGLIKYIVLIIGGDMNALVGKGENKFYLHNS